jgi:putative PIN family toxin of toxin-antitoxin system
VIDTNVFISSLFGGNPLDVLKEVSDRRIDILYSQQTLSEIRNVLFRKKFDFISKDKKLIFIDFIVNNGIEIKVKSKIDLCRDKKDNMFLELTVDGIADYLISGDADLLTIRSINNIKIITPEEFLNTIRKSDK